MRSLMIAEPQLMGNNDKLPYDVKLGQKLQFPSLQIIQYDNRPRGFDKNLHVPEAV
jgi:hypothetical protein